jgi:heme-degrading monooxygenase HmoA
MKTGDAHRQAAQLPEGRRPVWLPWIAGPHEETAERVLVSLTEFRANGWRYLPGMARIALGLRAGWYGLPGAVGLYLWTDPARRCVGSLSVWTDEADLRRWIGLPRHVQVMRRYRPRGTARSTQWNCETFDRSAILVEAKQCLASGELSSHRSAATPT